MEGVYSAVYLFFPLFRLGIRVFTVGLKEGRGQGKGGGRLLSWRPFAFSANGVSVALCLHIGLDQMPDERCILLVTPDGRRFATGVVRSRLPFWVQAVVQIDWS